MLKFVIGVVTGALLAVGYVRFGIELPAALQLPERLRGNLVSTATEDALYVLDGDGTGAGDRAGDGAARTRALEVYFANRAADAAKFDAAAGHPFLGALHRARAVREARIVAGRWDAADAILAKPALRAALERKHATADPDALKRALLMEAIAERPFLAGWLGRHGGPVTPATVRERVMEVGWGR